MDSVLLLSRYSIRKDIFSHNINNITNLLVFPTQEPLIINTNLKLQWNRYLNKLSKLANFPVRLWTKNTTNHSIPSIFHSIPAATRNRAYRLGEPNTGRNSICMQIIKHACMCLPRRHLKHMQHKSGRFTKGLYSINMIWFATRIVSSFLIS